MLQLKNRTHFTATLFSAPDPEGIETLFAIVKGTFTLGPRVEEAEKQRRSSSPTASTATR